MTTTVLAFQHPHGAAASLGSGTHWFAIGLLVGVAAVFIAPAWLTALIVVFDLVALGWSSGILNYAHSSGGHWVWIAIPFLLIGLFVGLTRGLKALGESEYNARLGNIRKMGRYL